MFVLGFLYWMFDRPMENTIDFIQTKFSKNEDVREANLRALKAGYNFGDTTETFTTRYHVEKAKMEPGTYRNIMGNQALAMGLVAASSKSGLPLFLGSYPITPASDILHELAKYKNFGVKTFQRRMKLLQYAQPSVHHSADRWQLPPLQVRVWL
jgi:2-oxoglutarate ferredoxin oxidoreductase subunit alpha